MNDEKFGLIFPIVSGITVSVIAQTQETKIVINASSLGTIINIDYQLVVNNAGRHAAQEAAGTSVLKAGYHEIKVLFFQSGGDKEPGAGVE